MTAQTTALTPPQAGDTKRQFLVRNGLAKDGARGRFGKEAIAALALFPDFAFTEVVPTSKPKAPVTPEQAAAKQAEAQAKQQNGAERAAAALAKREAKEKARAERPKISQVRAAAPSPLDMPRRKQTVAYVVDPSIGNKTVAITSCARADKGGCGKPVNRCTHDTPLAPHYFPKGVALTPMSLTKPVV